MSVHVPVLLEEVLEVLALQPGQVVVDATFGGGGHSRELLKAVAPAPETTKRGGADHTSGKVIGLDRDPSVIDVATHGYKKEIDSGRLVLVQARFSELRNVLTELSVDPVNAILVDAGVSSMQLLSATRGFSFSGSAPLDMRMDPREDLTAARILAEWSEDDLRKQFLLVGERSAGRLAHAIVETRTQTPLERTDQLVELIKKTVGHKGGRPRSNRSSGTGQLHPATKVFLALRMAVNHELEELQNGLAAALHSLTPGGRLAVISFHSTEDRIIKRTLAEWQRGCICPPELPVCRCGHTPLARLITKKPITPTPHERATNPRARSAKLRACIKL